MTSEPRVVVYDACVLYPFHLRNLLVQVGVHGIVQPKWTDEIQDEWTRHLIAVSPEAREALARACNLMNGTLPGANVSCYQRHIASISLPDANDRHVVAAAIESGATAVITWNLKDFPREPLAQRGIEALSPDDFLTAIYDDDSETMVAVVEEARLNLRRTTPSYDGYVAELERSGLTTFVSRLRGPGPSP
jgi:hypothetical protein